MPFGEDLGAGQFGRTTALGYEPSGTPSNPREKFATYERDDETGLDFAQARYYQNKLGRFTSVDPLMASATPIEPQSWNRYSYVGNRPLVFNDPTGMIWLRNKETNSIGWYSGDRVLRGYEEVKVGTVVPVDHGQGRFRDLEGHTVRLGKDGQVSDLGLTPKEQKELDFQNGFGTDITTAFIETTVKIGIQTGLSGGVSLIRSFASLLSELSGEDIPSRNTGFRQAKRDAKLAANQHPDRVERKFLIEDGQIVMQNGQPVVTREYVYTRNGDGAGIVIQEHSLGHYRGQIGEQGPHFNVRSSGDRRGNPLDGTKAHYPFTKKP